MNEASTDQHQTVVDVGVWTSCKQIVSRGSLNILWMIIQNMMCGSEILVVGNRQDSQKESASEFSVHLFIAAGMGGGGGGGFLGQ
jgi:hypothetical protein